MSVIKKLFKKVEKSTFEEHQSHLSESQVKTIKALRKLGKKNRTELIDLLKNKKNDQENEKDTPESTKQFIKTKLKAKVNVPVEISDDVRKLLADIDPNDIIYERESNLSNGPFGVRLEKRGNEVIAKVRYSKTPAALKSSFHKNQGDLNYKRLIAQSTSNGLNDTTLENPIEETDGTATDDNSEMPSSNDNLISESNSDYKQGIDELTKGILKPKQLDLLSKNSVRLDNVAWHDFSEYIYTLDPYLDENSGQTFNIPFIGRRFPDRNNELGASTDELPDSTEGKDTTDLFIETIIQNQDEETAIIGSSRFYHDLLSSFNNDIRSDKLENEGNIGFNYAFNKNTNNSHIVSKKIVDILFTKKGMESTLASLLEIYWSLSSRSNRILYLSSLVRTFTNVLSCFGNFPETFSETNLACQVYLKLIKYNYSLESNFSLAWISVADEVAYNWNTEPEPEIEFPPPHPFSFKPFPRYTYNLGLRLVYRQEWRPLGIQHGETVRTIPLGPKQVEKVSTKIIRRRKVTTTSENLKSQETTTESSETIKDSSEIVNEATESFKWNVEAEASGGISGVFSAKVSTQYDEESINKSKNTSNHLSETMQKMASKQRSETKVVVNTEKETTFEETSSSEIQNPNEEIPITYVYSKIQRQYEILTSLAEVCNVVMVAEPIPSPEEINFEWVSKNDWILAKNLLDNSFRDALTSVSQESVGSGTPNLAEDLKTTKDATVGHLGTLATSSSNLSISEIDVTQEAQRAYREVVKEEAERKRQHYMQERKRYRLYEHIRKNILHYMRALWSQEDPQERMLRYRKQGIMVPLVWESLLTDDNDNIIAKEATPVDDCEEVNIADLINPAGPIGYHGNYAIFYMRPEYASKEMFEMLHQLKNPYLYPSTEDPQDNQEQILMDPLLRKYKDKVDDEGITPNDNDKKEMICLVPELRLKAEISRDKDPDIADEDIITQMESEDSNEYQIFTDYYAEYLFRNEQSRRFLVETNNLMIDILPGEGSALEGFKRAHRGIDVLKAIEEKEQMNLENQRRQGLIDNGKYGDPDIDKVTVITGTNNLSDIIALDSDDQT